MNPIRVLIAGAAGRDFHNFNVVYRGRDDVEVVAFTATQIPNIEGRVYPPQLAGDKYPDGIPILPESDLGRLVREHDDRRGRLLVLGRRARARHAPRFARACGGGGLRPPLPARHDARGVEAVCCDLRGPHGLGQEPDDAARGGAAARVGQARRGPAPPDALRRPREAGASSASSATRTSRPPTRRSRSARSTSRTSPRATSCSPASTTRRSSSARRRKPT